MKSIKEHMMFILPLMAILLGIEFFLAFSRVTGSYEERLRESYSILVVSSKKISESTFKKMDPRIINAREIRKETIAAEISKDMDKDTKNKILDVLPAFYTLHLSSYLNRDEVEKIRKKILKHPVIKKVETFGESHRSKYNLFLFIKIIFRTFVVLMSMVSVFLIVKQMEVWQMAHRERMRIMEIFGAPMMLRSGVLFRIAVTDALLAAFFSGSVFLFVKIFWAPRSGIDLLGEKQDLLFQVTDLFILILVALFMVIAAVFTVTLGSREIRE